MSCLTSSINWRGTKMWSCRSTTTLSKTAIMSGVFITKTKLKWRSTPATTMKKYSPIGTGRSFTGTLAAVTSTIRLGSWNSRKSIRSSRRLWGLNVILASWQSKGSQRKTTSYRSTTWSAWTCTATFPWRSSTRSWPRRARAGRRIYKSITLSSPNKKT